MSCGSDCCAGDGRELAASPRRRVLYAVLVINAVMFGLELAAGLWAGSTALLADSLDMLADALVFGVSLWAVARGARARAAAGLSNAALEGLLGLAVLAQVGYHVVVPVSPMGVVMMAVSAVALAANAGCGVLLLGFRHEDINMRAVWLCTRNDALGNAGTIVGGALVLLLGSKWPDLVVGGGMAFLLVRTAVSVGRESWSELWPRGGPGVREAARDVPR